LKHLFQEILNKFDFTVNFLPNVIICCTILHNILDNILLGQSHVEVEDFLHILRIEGLQANAQQEEGPQFDSGGAIPNDMATTLGLEKKTALGLHLTTRRRHLL